MLGPSEAIGSTPCKECWAHSRPLVESHANYTGPIEGHQCYDYEKSLGPLSIIGQIFHRQCWAHLRQSMVSIVKNAGPIQAIGRVTCQLYWAHWRPSVWPIALDPLVIMHRMFYRCLWAHLKPLVVFIINAGPIQSSWQNALVEKLGPIMAIGKWVLLAHTIASSQSFMSNGPMNTWSTLYISSKWAHP